MAVIISGSRRAWRSGCRWWQQCYRRGLICGCNLVEAWNRGRLNCRCTYRREETGSRSRAGEICGIYEEWSEWLRGVFVVIGLLSCLGQVLSLEISGDAVRDCLSL